MITIDIRTALGALVEEIRALERLPEAERIVRSGWALDRAARAIESAIEALSPPPRLKVENGGDGGETAISTTTTTL